MPKTMTVHKALIRKDPKKYGKLLSFKNPQEVIAEKIIEQEKKIAKLESVVAELEIRNADLIAEMAKMKKPVVQKPKVEKKKDEEVKKDEEKKK